jgi:hypothetical protein
MNADRIVVVFVLLVLCWARPALIAQEPVDLEKATKPSETAEKKTADDVTPSPIPAKPAAKKAERSTETGATTKRTEAAKAEETSAVSTKSSAPEKPRKSVSETMRPEEFRAAGLDKLDEDELQHLDAWLQGYRQTTEKKATQQAETKATEQIKKAKEEAAAAVPVRTRLDSLVSRVDGTFSGLKGRTLIRLEDGTVWKQADRDAIVRTAPLDHPDAVILHNTFGYKMRIQGVGNDFYVDPVSR